MYKLAVRQFLTITLLLLYLNRGLFISGATEMETPGGEINTVAEMLVALITGESNDIDEDGDNQTDCNHVKIVQHDFSQQLAQSIELMNLFSNNIIKHQIPDKEALPIKDFYCRIERPPEV
jgi:hypothetical protein